MSSFHGNSGQDWTVANVGRSSKPFKKPTEADKKQDLTKAMRSGQVSTAAKMGGERGASWVRVGGCVRVRVNVTVRVPRAAAYADPAPVVRVRMRVMVKAKVGREGDG